jgi:hypothetical protein
MFMRPLTPRRRATGMRNRPLRSHPPENRFASRHFQPPQPSRRWSTKRWRKWSINHASIRCDVCCQISHSVVRSAFHLIRHPFLFLNRIRPLALPALSVKLKKMARRFACASIRLLPTSVKAPSKSPGRFPLDRAPAKPSRFPCRNAYTTATAVTVISLVAA